MALYFHINIEYSNKEQYKVNKYINKPGVYTISKNLGTISKFKESCTRHEVISILRPHNC